MITNHPALPGAERVTAVLIRVDHRGRAFWADQLCTIDHRNQRDGALAAVVTLTETPDPLLLEHFLGGTTLVDEDGNPAGWAAPWALAGRHVDLHAWQAVIVDGAVTSYRHWILPDVLIVDYVTEGSTTVSVRLDDAGAVRVLNESELPQWTYGPEEVMS